MDKETNLLNLKNSDRKAFDELFKYFYKPLCRFAYTILHCSASSEEVVQDVFLKLWENRLKINVQINITSYLYIAVKNTSLNYLKFHTIRKKYEEQNNPEPDDELIIDENLFKNYLKKAIPQLPDQCRIIFHLKNFEGLTHSEIAEYMDISEKTVENQVHIALKKLREYLQPYKKNLLIEKYDE